MAKINRTCGCLGIVLLLGCGGGGRASVDAGTGGTPAGGAVGSAGTGGTDAGGNGTGGGAGTGNAVTGIVLADGEDSPTSIAIDATDVYWTTSGEVRRVAKSGGTAVTVYGSEYEPYEVNVDDTTLYWFHLRLGTDQRDVVRAPKSGAGPITVVAMGTVDTAGLVSDADSLFWLIPDGSNEVLRSVPKAGGVAPTSLATQVQLGVLALDDQYVYWGQTGPPRVQRIAKTGGAVQDFATGEPNSVDLPIPDDTDVYFVSEWNDALPDHVAKIPKGGGGSVTTLATDLDPVKQLALAEDAVYALVDLGLDAPGYIAKVPKAGGGATKLVTDTQSPQEMAVDDQYVYWAEPGPDGAHAGRIRKIAR